MRIERLDVDQEAREQGLTATAARLRSLVPSAADVEGEVREILARVRAGGDEAVRDYTRRFDTGGNEPQALLLAPHELTEALERLSPELVAGLQVAIANVALVAQAGVSEDIRVDLPQGHQVVLREVPVQTSAVYVPGGRAPYASTVVMGVVSARAAGVIDVAVCAPPGVDGQIDPSILGTCRLCGVERVYRMGGAQAIAALAYGTETVGRADVVVGPGNLYVQEAKRQLSATIGIDGFAGPSDLLVLLGQDAGELDLRLAALDMLAQGEHGEASLVVAASPDARARDALAEELHALGASRPHAAGAAFALVGVSDAREAVGLANALAPEHLQLIGAEMESLAGSVRSAGCLFIGSESATAFGDYVAGSNHVLPTGGAARFASGLSPRHFRRRMSVVRIGQAAGELAVAGAAIARAEGFEVHAESMEARAGANPLAGSSQP